MNEGMLHHLNKLEFPLPKDNYSKFGWNWPSGSGEEDENVKSFKTDKQTDDEQKVYRKAHFIYVMWA